ncbi:polysaccharide deacetylase family protein [Silvibacterium acidisoli]|uniref:polysaccharide deacetylase family protein n=1 Tax=Acidobacteriaceae bacterium ZG23-2 TaxID=2883246 RepID=UPI00406D3AC9
MPDVRADRLLTINVVEPLHRAFRVNISARIPMLMYHGISDQLGDRHPYFETSTSAAVFASHMQYLRDQGYRALSVPVALQMLADGNECSRTVVITFDDGCRDFYTEAMPILQKCGLNATLFVVTGIADGHPHHFGNTKFMTWPEIREAAQSGIDVGSHTVSHPKLHSLSEANVRRELEQSKWTIEDKLGRPVRTISYPYAFPEEDPSFRSSLRHSVQQAGYTYGLTTIVGRGARSCDQYFLPRLPMNQHDDLRLFKAKLEGAYDWIRGPQAIYKRLGRLSIKKSRAVIAGQA